MSEHQQDLLFVYGTLQSGHENRFGQLLQSRARLVGDGVIQARLYFISDPDAPGRGYPGALPSPSPSDLVYGEIYDVAEQADVWSALDEYEGCSAAWPEPHEFLRRAVPVQRIDAKSQENPMVVAQCYLYTWDVSRADLIADGRFSRYCATQRGSVV